MTGQEPLLPHRPRVPPAPTTEGAATRRPSSSKVVPPPVTVECPGPRLSACSHWAGLRQGGLGAGGAGGDMCGRMMAVSPDSAFRFFQMEISR